MQTPEQMALSFTGECEPASLGICANHKAPLGGATTCLHVLHLSELIRDRDAEVAARALREAEGDYSHLYRTQGPAATAVAAVTCAALRDHADRIEREAGVGGEVDLTKSL